MQQTAFLQRSILILQSLTATVDSSVHDFLEDKAMGVQLLGPEPMGLDNRLPQDENSTSASMLHSLEQTDPGWLVLLHDRVSKPALQPIELV